MDVYEWINCKVVDAKQKLFVKVTQGSEEIEAVEAKYKKATGNYYFVEKKLPDLRGEFPTDFNQIPDIIINFYINEGETPTNRVGYIRMKAKDLAVKETIPQWVRIKSIYNNSSGNELGQILMNAQFLRFDPGGVQPNRVVKDKSGKQQYKFYY